MRPTFALTFDNRLISVNAPKEQPHALRIGDVLVLAHDYATEYGKVPAGTKLFVQYVDETDCTTWLRAEGDVPALFHWDNQMALVPYDTEDLLQCLRVASNARSNVRPMLRLIAAGAFLVASLAPVGMAYTRIDVRHSQQTSQSIELIDAEATIRNNSTG